MEEPTNEQLLEKLKGNVKDFYNWAYNSAISDAIAAVKYVNKFQNTSDEEEALNRLKK